MIKGHNEPGAWDRLFFPIDQGHLGFTVKVTPNLRGSPPEKKFIRALFLMKPLPPKKLHISRKAVKCRIR